MMLRNGKLTTLMMATACVAGCANSQGKISQKPEYQGNTPQPRVDPRRVKDVRIPKIRPETHLAAGRMFESRGQWNKALAQYRKAVAVNSRDVNAYHRMGLLASRLGSHDEAINAFSRAVKLRPKDATLCNNLGFELLSEERFDEAQEALAQAVKLDPTFARAHVNFGMLQCKLGRFDDGLASFLTVLPEADAFYNLGLMYRGQKRYIEAARAFRQVLVIEPSFTAAMTQIEKMKERMSRATSPRRESNFAARTIDQRPREITTAPRNTQPVRRKRDDEPATKIDPTASNRDDDQPWANTFAMIETALSMNGPVDAFPMTDVPSTMLDGYPLEDMVALEEIADNERDCLQEEADLRAARIDREIKTTMALASADDGKIITCEALAVCDAVDVQLYSMNTYERAIPATFIEDMPASWMSAARDLPLQASRTDELRRLLRDEAPMVAGMVLPEKNESLADWVWEFDVQVGTQTSPATYTIPVKASMIATDMTEWDLVPLRVATETLSTVDSLALFKSLADELAIVRNEIDCVEQDARVASATKPRPMISATDRRPRMKADLSALLNGLVGPPAALAIPVSYRPASTPAAFLGSQPRNSRSRPAMAPLGSQKRSGTINTKRVRRTKTSQATPLANEDRTVDLQGSSRHEPNPQPN